MEGPLLPSILPLEIRSRIYLFLDDWVLAEQVPEVFWALSQEIFRFCSLGIKANGEQGIQTRLAQMYPTTGNLVERLILMTDPITVKIIRKFLINFPTQRKLKHLCISLSPHDKSYIEAASLPYFKNLKKLISNSSNMTRLSFYNLW
jgi:hypothetical protein